MIAHKGNGIVGPPTSLKRDIRGPIPMGFKPTSLAKFDGCSDPYEHIISINTQMAIIRVPDSLKCNMLSRNFREVSLRWYMGLPHATINSCQKLLKKLVYQFFASLHRKMSSTSLFNIHQCLPESSHQTRKWFWENSKMDLMWDTSTNLSPRS